jgi:hypothetical protein
MTASLSYIHLCVCLGGGGCTSPKDNVTSILCVQVHVPRGSMLAQVRRTAPPPRCHLHSVLLDLPCGSFVVLALFIPTLSSLASTAQHTTF